MISYEPLKQHHGIFLNKSKENIEDIKIKLDKFGMFPRIVKTVTLNHYNSPFSTFLTDYDFHNSNRVKFHKNITNYSIGSKEFKMTDFIETDVKELVNLFNEEYLKSELTYYPNKFKESLEATTSILRNYILTFVASSLARYNPVLWREIYEGETTPYYNDFKKAFQDHVNYLKFVSYDVNRLEKRIKQSFTLNAMAYY